MYLETGYLRYFISGNPQSLLIGQEVFDIRFRLLSFRKHFLRFFEKLIMNLIADCLCLFNMRGPLSYIVNERAE